MNVVRARWIGPAVALVSVLAYTGINWLTRIVAVEADPLAAATLRQAPLVLVASVGLLVVGAPHLRGRGDNLGPRRTALLIAGGVVSFVIGNALMVVGFAKAGLGVGVVATQGGMVLGGMVMGAWILRESIRRAEIWAGVAVLVGLGATASASFAVAGWGGFLAALGAGICFTSANAVGRAVLVVFPGAFWEVLFLTNLAGFLGAGLGYVVGAMWEGRPLVVGFLQGAGPLLTIGVVNVIATGALTLALRFSSVSLVSTISALVIPLSTLVAIVVFDEAYGPADFVGGMLVVAGVLGATLSSGATAHDGSRDSNEAQGAVDSPLVRY